MKNNNDGKSLVPQDFVIESILIIRGQKVILDSDLAMLYGVEVKKLNQAVKRNQERFPDDFAFQLTAEEYANLRSQFVTSKIKDPRGGRRYLPYAFTEHGALMAATVLSSQRAVEMSLVIIRTFIKLRNILMEHKDLKKKIEQLEKKYDKNFLVVFQAIKKLMEPPKEIKKPKAPFGFSTK